MSTQPIHKSIASDLDDAFSSKPSNGVTVTDADGQLLHLPDAVRTAPDPSRPHDRLVGTPCWQGPVFSSAGREVEPWPLVQAHGPVLSARLVLENCVGQPDGCWHWRGVTFVGERPRTVYTVMGRQERVPRVAWAAYFGPLPLNTAIRMVCGDPTCCNPAHMVLGPHRMRSRRTALDTSPLTGRTLQAVEQLYDKHRDTAATARRALRNSVDRGPVMSPYRDGRTRTGPRRRWG